MSRIANMPISIPAGVEITLNGQELVVKSNKGELSRTIHASVEVKIEENQILFAPREEFQKEGNVQAGTSRSLVNSMVIGLTEGFTTKLKLVGVGYRAQVEGKSLALNLGFSHPVSYAIPEGITITCPTPTDIEVSGADKQAVGQTAAKIRAYRKPEPYKGKGVRYADEVIRLKEAKKK
ncbi:MAG: 50S ribosomal protein L6 [Psittacicella sp.]